MELKIRPLTENDYEETLVGWWESWGFTPPPRDFLPDDGKGGIMVYDGDVLVCAGFMYITNSRIAWINWIISNKEYRKKPQRKEAIDLLIKSLEDMSRITGSKYGYALIQNNKLVDIYKKLGYIDTHNYTQELIKVL